MTHLPSLRFALSLGLALSACNTEEIAPHQVAIKTTQSDPGQGALLIFFTTTGGTYAAEQARESTNPNLTEYHLFVDGHLVVFDNSGSATPVVVLEGDMVTAGYWSEGIHHFEFGASEAAAIFAGDGSIVAGAVNRLYLFGPLDALQGRFTSYATNPPAGSAHASVINLVRGEGSIELLSCTDASHCGAVSPPLALGETFEGDVPFVASDNELQSLSTSGAGLGYRLVPTPSLPAPPILPLLLSWDLAWVLNHSTLSTPANFVGAPIYMSSSPEGYVLQQWD